ncbi:MAG: tetratricopeptide repeat protein [Candidatus Brocadiales bacterium]
MNLSKTLTVAFAGLPIADVTDILSKLSHLKPLLKQAPSNLQLLLPILAVLIIGCIVGILVGRAKAKRNKLKKDALITKASKLLPDNLGIEKYADEYHYVPRESDEYLRRLLEEGAPRVLVLGKTGSGKTRTIYEAIKDKKDFIIFAPKHHTISSKNLKTMGSLRKKNVLLFLDDLDKHIKKIDIAMLIGQLEKNAKTLTVLATCRTGDTLTLVEKIEPSFLKQFENRIRIELRDLTADEEEALAKSLDRDWSPTMYDRTPGSVALDLPDMKARYKNASNEGKAITWLLKILHSSFIYDCKENLVKKLFNMTFEKEPHIRANWGKALTEMVETGLITRKAGYLNIYDAYLDNDFIYDYSPGEEDYQMLEALLTKEKDAEALFSMGIFYDTKNQLDKSIGVLEKAVEFDSNHIGARLCLAAAHEKKNMLEEAITQYKEVMKTSPDNAQVHYRLGLIYYNQNMIEEALEEFRSAANINPNHIEAHYNLALVYEKLEQVEDAIAEYRETIRLGPAHLDAHRNLAFIYNKKGMVYEAIREFKEVAWLNPDDAEVHYILASAYSESGKTEEAIAEYKELVRINPDDVKAQYNLAVSYYKMGKLEGTIEAFKEVIRVNPDDVRAHYNLGLAHYKKNMVDDAVREYEEVLRLKPGDPAAYYNLALCYDRKGIIDKAIDGFKEAIRNYPNHPDAHRYLALAYNKKDMFDAAIEEFKEALRIRPKDPTAHGGLALAYHKKGMTTEARKEFRIYEQLKAQLAKPRQ